MFIPYNDDTPRYRMQYVTFAIIAINVLVHIYKMTLNEDAEVELLLNYASLGGSYSLSRAFTAGFLHDDVLHLLGNMWFLFLFGSSVEGKLGHHWMAAIYGVCLLMSDAAQHIFSPANYLLGFGASGAVGGMVGAYWFLFSRAKVEFFYLFTFWIYGTMSLAVHWAVVWLFGWDIVMWVLEKYYHVESSVAHSAHLGGVVCGLLCGFLLRRFTHVILDGDDIYTRTVVWWRKREARKSYADRMNRPSIIDQHRFEPPGPPPPERATLALDEDPSVPERIPFPTEEPQKPPPATPARHPHGIKELPLD